MSRANKREKFASGSDTTTKSATVKITPVELTITADSAVQIYNGMALTKNSYSITAGKFVGSEGFASVTVEGSRTMAGSSKNEITAYTFAAGTNEDNYLVKCNDGVLEVTRASIAITVKAADATWTYDGNAHSADSATLTEGTLANGDTLVCTVSGSITDAGSVTNTLSDVKVMHGDADVTENYAVAKKNGTLTVNPVAITLKANSASRAYNGEALTDSGYQITGGAFVGEDGLATVTVKGSQTMEGSSENVITGHTLSTATNAANYKIGYESGLLTVTAPQAKTITIRTASDSKTYDGTALVNHGYTYTDHVLATGDVLYVTMGTSITNAGTAKNTVASHKVMHGDVDVSRYYTINVEEGTLTVSPAKITLTSETKTQEYNGSALTAPNVTATGDAFAAGEGFAALTATGSQTIVGSAKNSISYALTEKTLASNYEITPKPGTLTVTQNTTTIKATADSTHKTYDGTALTLDTATVTGLPEGFTATVTMKAESTITNAGDKANEIDTVVIKNANGEDVTAYFQNITKVNGTLTVTKATVTLGTASAEKQYDGTALTKTDATTQTGFVKGEGVVITATGRQTVPGSSNNTFTYTETENTKLSNYNILPVYGTLTVTKNTTLITITAGSASRLYDGTALTNGAATVTGLPEGFTATYTITADSTITNVGTHANTIDKADIRLSGNIVTDYFSNINLVGGTLQVTPRTIMLGSDTATKEYDGTPLTAPTVAVTGDGFAKNEGFVADSLKATGTQTELGKCINAIAYALNSKTSAGNYTISTNPGTLSVTKNTKTITITAADAEKSYDGTPLTATGYTYTQGILANGDVLTATTSGTITDAGKTANTITGYHITRADGTDVTGYYTLATKTGTLTVSAQKIVLQAASDSKPYDGNPLTKNGFAVVSGTFADGQGVESVVTKGSQEMVGSSANTITSHTLKAGTDAKNYEISYLPGTLSVTNENPIALTVSADSGTFTYDGTAHSKATATITAGKLASGDTLHYTVTGSITNAGETANVISDITVLHGDIDVTANYAIAPANGTLTVEKAKATVSTKNASKVYDGTALTQMDTVQTGFAKGEGVTFDITGIQLFAGSSDNSFTYTANEGTNLANYDISETVGTLTVTKASIRISVSAASENYTYDGTTHSNSSVIVKGTFASGDTLKASASGSIRNAGKATNELGTVTVMHGTTDVTENYAITASNGSLVVSPKAATITLKNAEQEYDGTPLTSNAFTTDGFIEADAVASVTASGSQTVAGSTRNTIVSHTLRDGVLAGNYKIGYEAADLTVLPKAAPITLTAANAEKVYDGTALTTPNFTYTADVLVEGDTLYAAVTGSRTNVGSTNSSIETFSVKNAAGKDVTACYTFADPMTGTLTVTPKAVTVTGAVGSFTYDGAAHTVSGGSVTGLIDGQTMNASVSSVSRTEIGTSYMGLAGAVYQVVIGNATGAIENGEVCEFIDNYTLTITDGSITINAAAVTPADPDTTPTDPDTTPTRPTTPVRPTTPGTTETIDDTTTGTTETITDTETPLGEGTAPENIEDADVPLAAAGAWALLNLLFTIATAIGSILLLITSFTRRANDKDDAKESKQNAETSDKETSRGDVNRHGVWRVLSVILTIVSVIVFIVTENMALPMVLLDKWTLIMALFTLVQILNMFLSQKSYSKDQNHKDGAAGAEG